VTHELSAINHKTVLRGVSLFLLLVSLLRAGIAAAQQYFAVEQTAVDDVADIPDPGTLGIDVDTVIRRAIVLLRARKSPRGSRMRILISFRAYEFERHSSAAISTRPSRLAARRCSRQVISLTSSVSARGTTFRKASIHRLRPTPPDFSQSMGETSPS
jgi:hypothetical protein